MAAVRSDLYIALTKAGVPEETAGKLAASKFEVEETLIAVFKTIGKVRKCQQTLDGRCAKC